MKPLEIIMILISTLKNQLFPFSLSITKSALTRSKEDMACYYDHQCEPTPIYAPGDKGFLDASDICTTRPSKKLSHRRLGPYVIEKRVGSHAYKLCLPTVLSCLHPVFPVVKLTPAPKDPIPGQKPTPPPPPVLHEGEEHFEVELLFDSRMRNNRLQFLIKWKGDGYEENSWENEGDVNAPTSSLTSIAHTWGLDVKFIHWLELTSVHACQCPRLVYMCQVATL
jgi:hypothetical protein